MTKAKESKGKDATPGFEPGSEQGMESLLTPAEIKNLLAELERERELRVRALADFDNYRKRIERERVSAAQSGKRAIILGLLEVMDDFDRALGHTGQSSDAVVEGLRAIHKRLAGLLQAQGVTPIDSVGEKFDPSMHEAIGAIEADDAKPGTIIDEISRGYLWNNELLRPARVRVAT